MISTAQPPRRRLVALAFSAGPISRRLTTTCLGIIALLAVVVIAVAHRVTTDSIEARAASEIQSDLAVLQLTLYQLEDDLVFLNELLASSQLLTEQLTGPSASRSLMISLLSDLRHRGMTVHMHQQKPPADSPDFPVVQKGFLGIRTLALVVHPATGDSEIELVSVAPIESPHGVNHVASISFPVTVSYLKIIARRIGSDITLLLPHGQLISTLAPPAIDALRQWLAGKRGPSATVDAAEILPTTTIGEPIKLLIAPLVINHKNEGTLILTMPMADLLAAQRAIVSRVLVSTGALLSATLILYFLLIRRITRPLGELSAATRAVAGGNLALQVTVARDDEIGALATSFNSMVQRLRESREEIERWNQTLEERVRERTESLESARAALKATNEQLVAALEEVQRTQSQMVRTEKLAALGQMASAVAHEVQNPLTGMKGALQVLLREGSCGDRAPVVQLVIDQIDRLSQTTSRLLSFARPATPRRAPTNLATLIGETRLLVSEQAAQKGVNIVLQLEPTDRPVLLDPRLTVQAFLNIALNAVQAMEQGGTLTITSRLLPETKELRVTFADTGGGIPPDVLAKIFTPFFTTKTQGTGLGLHVAREIIEQQGGGIDVTNTPGVGATFTVRLPTVDDSAAPEG